MKKQLSMDRSIGCSDFDDDEVVANIVLQGLHSNNKLYSATLAEQKATLIRNPSAITLTSLEDTFFSIDNSTASSRRGDSRDGNRDGKRRERANFANSRNNSNSNKKMLCYNCGESGHTKRECPKLKQSYQKKDLSTITCHFCRKKGHYANKCPERYPASGTRKKVTFESAHISSEREEHAAAAIEIVFDSSAIRQRNSFNQSSTSDSSTIASSLPDFIENKTVQKASLHQSPVRSFHQQQQIRSGPPPMVGSPIVPYNSDFSNEDEAAMMAAHPVDVNAPPISTTLGDFGLWLLDSGATSHFTPSFDDLIDPVVLDPPVYIRVADGSRMRASHQGLVELNFTSDQEVSTSLRLLRVLYVPGLQTRLFSIESFVSSGDFRAVYSKGEVCLEFSASVSITIQLPHVPPATYISRETCKIPDEMEQGFATRINPKVIVNGTSQGTWVGSNIDSFAAMAQEEQADKTGKQASMIDDEHCAGGENAPMWNPTKWDEDRLKKNKKRMNVELGHSIFGHRAISSLLSASHNSVWDDITMVCTGDSWCDTCKVSIAARNIISKQPMRINQAPLEHMFIDCVPSPGTIRGMAEANTSNFLFLCDPVSKYVEKLNVMDKSAEETIRALTAWRGKMIKKGFPTFMYLRADAGSNFTSHKFKEWCSNNKITLSIAGPKHQEQNAFVERAYGTASRMARSMLVKAHLPIAFYHLALQYSCKKMRVLPAKGLLDSEGKPTTTYAILHGKKPRIGRFKVFGCPCVFKRYAPNSDGSKTTDFKQLQKGSRGIFVGFPEDQAGWLVYVPEKISGSHVVVSMDVAFDQYFVSGINATKTEFDGSQTVRNVGKHGGNLGQISESTGDAKNLGNSSISHWG